jgi:hypothetical protein
MRTTAHLSLFLALGAAAACTADPADDTGDATSNGAKLTIVGEEALRLENEWATELTVRYTDLEGFPLQGDIDFALDGDVAGAFLSGTTVHTDGEGLATITLTAGTTGDATFAVAAETDDVEPVQWDVAVLANVLDIAGNYRLHSQFDLASGIPGTAGTVINTFIDMTDDPYDPATWMLDKIIESVNNGTVESFLNSARPGLDALLKELLVQLSPDIVGQIIHLGDAFGQVTREFGTASTLQVTAGSDTAQHVLTDFVFTVDGNDYGYPFAELGMPNVTAPASFSYDATRFTVGAHDLPLSYGSIMMVALEQLIIPLIDPDASDLGSLFAELIDCAAVGQEIADAIGFGSAGLYEGACVLGVGAAAGAIEDQIRALDQSAMVLGIHGTVRWMDTNHDSKVDVLQNGDWLGQMTYASTPAPLGDSPFHGERMAP